MTPTCNCRPLRIVNGVRWRYRPDLGWHDPAQHAAATAQPPPGRTA